MKQYALLALLATALSLPALAQEVPGLIISQTDTLAVTFLPHKHWNLTNPEKNLHDYFTHINYKTANGVHYTLRASQGEATELQFFAQDSVQRYSYLTVGDLDAYFLILAEGAVNMYRMHYEQDMGNTIRIEPACILKRGTGKPIAINYFSMNKRWGKKVVARFFGDCPEAATRAKAINDNNRSPYFKEGPMLNNVVKVYNATCANAEPLALTLHKAGGEASTIALPGIVAPNDLLLGLDMLSDVEAIDVETPNGQVAFRMLTPHNEDRPMFCLRERSGAINLYTAYEFMSLAGVTAGKTKYILEDTATGQWLVLPQDLDRRLKLLRKFFNACPKLLRYMKSGDTREHARNIPLLVELYNRGCVE